MSDARQAPPRATADAAMGVSSSNDASPHAAGRAVQDPDFRTWWANHQVTGTHYGTKPNGSGQRLMVLTAEPGTPSHQGLRILASWAAPALRPHAAAT